MVFAPYTEPSRRKDRLGKNNPKIPPGHRFRQSRQRSAPGVTGFAPMKFGVSTWLWTSPFSTATVGLFPKIKRMGFDFVEVPIEEPGLIDGKVVRRALDDHGLACVGCGAFGPTRDLTHEDPKVHAVCFDYIDRSLDLCRELGTDVLAGPMYSAVGKRRLLPPAERRKEWQRAVTNLRKACDLAASRQVRLAIEPLNRFET